MRYQYQALYELEGLAVINIRDLGPVKYAFKLMMFPDTRVLQCANSNDKVSSLIHCCNYLKLNNFFDFFFRKSGSKLLI